MKILLVAATELEIQPYLNVISGTIKEGKIVETMITGIGTSKTIYRLTSKLSVEKYDLVIQAGIAGSFSKKIKIGDVVLVGRDTFTGPGVEENGNYKSFFQVGLADKNEFPFIQGWLINNNMNLNPSQLKVVNGITTDIITDEKKQVKKLKRKFDARIETMEGAALHYVCLQQNVPFLQLRSISNYVGIRDKSKWKMKDAIKNLHTELMILINEPAINNSRSI